MTDKTKEELEQFQGELSGSRKGLYSGTYIAQIKNEEGLQKKEKKQKEFTDLILESLIEDLERLVIELNDLILKRQENLTQLKRASDILEDWNTLDAQKFLLNQGIDIEGMDENTLRDMVADQIEVFVNRDSSLADQIANKAKEAESKMKGQAIDPEFSTELLRMVRDAESLGIDADNAIAEAYRMTDYANETLMRADSDFKLEEKRAALTSRSPSISFANTENDPFAEVIDNITDPFNAVTAGLDLEPETKNGLNQEAVSPTIKSEVLTLKN